MKLTEYCQANDISMLELSRLTGLSRAMLYNIDKGSSPTIDTINKIFFSTKKRFGVGLLAERYTNLYRE